MNDVLAANVAALMAVLNEDQTVFAERLGVSQSSVSKWGKSTPRGQILTDLADLAGVTPKEFLHRQLSPEDIQSHLDGSLVRRGWVPKAATMQRLLAFVVRSSPASQIREADIQWFARGLVAGLELLAADPSKEDSEDYLAAVEHQIARSLRESTPKPSQAA